MPPLQLDSPTIIHHMAALDNSLAPPNSLEAIQECLDAGAAIIELDVTALADHDYLLVHDPELESETSGQGWVAECTRAHARELFIKHAGIVTQYRAALLSDAVKLVQNHSSPSRLQLDFKNVIPLPNDGPLHRLINLIEPLGERVIVSTGADWQLRRLRKLAPWLMLGFDIMWYVDWQPMGTPRDPRAFPKQRGAYGYFDDHMLATARHWSVAEYLRDRCETLMGLVPDTSAFYLEHPLIMQSLEDGFNWAEALQERGIKLDAWTMDVTDPVVPATAPRFLAAGVDMFTTNTPRALAELLV
jgi:glycerophosphoryl diester phosphodiesterase